MMLWPLRPHYPFSFLFCRVLRGPIRRERISSELPSVVVLRNRCFGAVQLDGCHAVSAEKGEEILHHLQNSSNSDDHPLAPVPMLELNNAPFF